MMKTLQNSRKIFFLIVTLLFVPIYLSAQTPQYYNSALDGTPNSFPFNTAGGKMIQAIIPTGNLITPSPAPSGNITKFYIRIASAYPLGPATYTDFNILMAQSTMTEFTGAFYTDPMDTVYKRASVTLTAPGASWLEFVLDHPFAYDPTKSLIVQIGQCNVTGTFSGFSLAQTVVTTNTRVYSTAGCPFTYGGPQLRIINCGIDVAPPSSNLPDLIYYKFKNNPSPTTVLNYAVPGAGNPTGTLNNMTLTAPGQFDSCLSGTAITAANITTGYSLMTGTSSFTISFWIKDNVTPTTTRYLFGDGGHSFRCFIGGVAPTGGAIFRGTGITDVPITNILPGPTVVHLVYDSAASNVKVYKNGVLDNTVSQTPFNFSAGTGFSVGGYNSLSASLEGTMDEFRFYKRALDQAEITATWNVDLGTSTNIQPVVGDLPKNYTLSQNYPNPFNPVTKINFSIPKAGFVTLKVYDVLGREVSVLVNSQKIAGSYTVDFNASALTSGVYFYKLETNGFSDIKKMMLIK